MKHIALFVCCFLNWGTAFGNTTDSVMVVIQDIKSGIAIDFNYSLRLYFDNDSICTNAHFLKSDFLKIGNGVVGQLKLDIGNCHLQVPFSSDWFIEPVETLRFKLNFDIEDEEKCTKVYFLSKDFATHLISFKTNDSKDCKSSIYQSLEIITRYGGSDGGDYDYFLFGYPLEIALRGYYVMNLDDHDKIEVELRDSAFINILWKSGSKVLNQQDGYWGYNPNFKTIQFYFISPCIVEINEETVDLNKYGLLVDEVDSSKLYLVTYKMMEGIITKSSLGVLTKN